MRLPTKGELARLIELATSSVPTPFLLCKELLFAVRKLSWLRYNNEGLRKERGGKKKKREKKIKMPFSLRRFRSRVVIA